ncbi:MAG: PP2C family protein-serine/threonine phosphatase [Firmicutes bacterium]|nr:PP2C family protein-serine/threonine phosphatase [Bacillota bacterium]
MPEKTVREMNRLERRHFSLAARTFHATLLGSAVLGLVTLAVGLGLYTYSLVRQYITESFSLSRNAAAVLDELVDVEPLAGLVMDSYRGLDDAERAQTGTDAYRARFSAITEREDYQTVRRTLSKFGGYGNIDAIYLAMYDEESAAMVYIADPDEDPETAMLPCDWDPVTREGMKTFLDWNGEGMLYEIEHTANYGWLCTSGMPIRGQNGDTVAFVLTDISLDNLVHGMKNFVIQYAAAILITMLLMGYFVTRHMKKKLVEPINQITEAAELYAQDRRAGVKDIDHFGKLNIHTGDEVENLSLVMADMEQELNEHEEAMKTITAEKERVTTELSLATRIQAAMMPQIFPPYPERHEFDIFATMEPAKEVGGDFYDFFLIDEDHLCLVMADVSGKGIPAALFMMASKIILQSCAMLGKSAAEILNKTNEAICSNNQAGMFVTVWLGILEISSGKLTAASAGHEYPALRQAGGGFTLLKDRHGLVIGAMDCTKYKEYELQLEPGAKLFIYTDGVPEATDGEGNMFGRERMLAALNEQAGAAPEQILKNVRGAVDAFVKGAEKFDDLTMLCVEYKG